MVVSTTDTAPRQREVTDMTNKSSKLSNALMGLGLLVMAGVVVTIAFLVVAGPFLFTDSQPRDTGFWWGVLGWYTYASGSIAAFGRFHGPAGNADNSDDLIGIPVILGSWLSWFIIGAVRKARTK